MDDIPMEPTTSTGMPMETTSVTEPILAVPEPTSFADMPSSSKLVTMQKSFIKLPVNEQPKLPKPIPEPPEYAHCYFYDYISGISCKEMVHLPDIFCQAHVQIAGKQQSNFKQFQQAIRITAKSRKRMIEKGSYGMRFEFIDKDNPKPEPPPVDPKKPGRGRPSKKKPRVSQPIILPVLPEKPLTKKQKVWKKLWMQYERIFNPTDENIYNDIPEVNVMLKRLQILKDEALEGKFAFGLSNHPMIYSKNYMIFKKNLKLTKKEFINQFVKTSYKKLLMLVFYAWCSHNETVSKRYEMVLKDKQRKFVRKQIIRWRRCNFIGCHNICFEGFKKCLKHFDLSKHHQYIFHKDLNILEALKYFFMNNTRFVRHHPRFGRHNSFMRSKRYSCKIPKCLRQPKKDFGFILEKDADSEEFYKTVAII
uniref:Uncharacterized protein n=1 Tax=Panagrolaimus sp. JU765 TaxID=591449 RepID=A0AC34QU06_9BILA